MDTTAHHQDLITPWAFWWDWEKKKNVFFFFFFFFFLESNTLEWIDPYSLGVSVFKVFLLSTK